MLFLPIFFSLLISSEISLSSSHLFLLSLLSLLFRLSVEARNWLIRWWLGLGSVVVVDGMGLGLVNGVGLGLVNGVGLGLVNGVGLGLVNGVGLGLEVVEPCRSRPGGVGLGLEVVEPCRIWVFFSF